MVHAAATSSWPRVTWETLPWRPRDGAALSTRQRSRLPRSYDSAVVPNIADAAVELANDSAYGLGGAVFGADEEQAAAGCIIGRDYPAPIVEHAAERRRAVERYQAVAT